MLPDSDTRTIVRVLVNQSHKPGFYNINSSKKADQNWMHILGYISLWNMHAQNTDLSKNTYINQITCGREIVGRHNNFC